MLLLLTAQKKNSNTRRLRRHGLVADCLYQFDKPVSPHIAAALKGRVPTDSEVTRGVFAKLSEYAREGADWSLVETAGGVHSPGPAGTSQADLYRPLRLPVVLVADSKLGGISTSISAWESLTVRGYDVAALIGFADNEYGNLDYLKKFFADKIPIVEAVEAPPAPAATTEADFQSMDAYYSKLASSSALNRVIQGLDRFHTERLEQVATLAERAERSLWYPFSQHTAIDKNSIVAIDSAYNDKFQVVTSHSESSSKSVLEQAFDGSASWWTQGLGHGNSELALTAANAAGRYGHVILAGTAHEPAVSLATKLIDTVHNPRLSRVFYSDNGSTGIEVALKMALTASAKRYGWSSSDSPPIILGLKNSYHGDTIGAMDASEPSVYNDKIHWYNNRGCYLDYPVVQLRRGTWKVVAEGELAQALGFDESSFSSLDAIYDTSRDASSYKDFLYHQISRLVRDQGIRFGALLFEPVLLGAGGMKAVDPLFQRALVEVVRENPDLFGKSTHSATVSESWKGLPVVFDEVFTGLYRLGHSTAASLLGCEPDISVHAKLLTGGLLPLCATLAGEDIFKVFLSDQKADALLHGHSYTAHPVGCAVALRSLTDLESICSNSQRYARVWSMWQQDFLSEVSSFDAVKGVFSAGTVMAITLKDSHAGYTSTASESLKQHLAHAIDLIGWNIHIRVLGNVVYIMASQTTAEADIAKMQDAVLAYLQKGN